MLTYSPAPNESDLLVFSVGAWSVQSLMRGVPLIHSRTPSSPLVLKR
jgi:hypothetical protein